MPDTIPHWTDVALSRALGPIRPASILRVHEPDSPESIYLREQAIRLKDSRAIGERYHEARERGLETEAASARDMGMRA